MEVCGIELELNQQKDKFEKAIRRAIAQRDYCIKTDMSYASEREIIEMMNEWDNEIKNILEQIK
jgi:hypothetical protein